MNVRCEQLKYKLLDIIMLSGEVFLKDFIALGYSREYITKTLNKLKTEKIVKEGWLNTYKTYRITTKGKKYLMNKDNKKYEPFLNYLSETNTIKTELKRRERKIKLAQIIIMLLQTKTKIFTCEKNYLYNEKSSDYPDDKSEVMEFYSSIELKSLIYEFQKARGSRALGILITATSICILYNTNDSLMTWHHATENKFRTLVEMEIARKIFKGRKNIKTVIVGDNGYMIEKILKSCGGVKKQKLGIFPDEENKHFISRLDFNITEFKTISDTEFFESIKTYVKNKYGLISYKKGTIFEISKDGVPFIYAFDLNLKLINDFCNYLDMWKSRGIIICFKHQKEYLEGYCGKCADFIEIEKGEFGIEESS